jgi:hypothetical protein
MIIAGGRNGVQMIRTVGLVLCLAAVIGLATACEFTVDRQTGERTTRFTLPGTEANEASFNERWRRCVQFASESQCAQQFGGRTPGDSAFSFGSGRSPDP